MGQDERVSFTLEMYRAQAPLPLYRHFLKRTWLAHWFCLRTKVSNDPELFAMFRCARFALPAHIGATVTAYRGTSGISASESARTGMSWSLDRDIACHFAYGLGAASWPGRPLVIEAAIPRERILMYSPSLDEVTVIPIVSNPAIKYRPSLPFDDWIAGHRRELNKLAKMSDLLTGSEAQALPPLERLTRMQSTIERPGA